MTTRRPRIPHEAFFGRPADLARLVDRAAPAEALTTSWPSDGVFGLYPSGITTIDFETGFVTSDKGREQLPIPLAVLKELQSFTFFVDVPAKVRITPGYGQFFEDNVQVVSASMRDLKVAQISTELPFVLLMTASTSPYAPGVVVPTINIARESCPLPGQGQAMPGAATIIKVNPAMTPDTWTYLGFVPYAGTKYLAPQFQAPYLPTVNYGQKGFGIRNLGAQDLEVQLFGALDPVLGASQGYYADKDNPSPVTVTAGTTKVLECGFPWEIMQVGVRIPAAVNAGLGTAVIVEFEGLTPSLR